jgi:hypothetical protein
MSIKNLTHMKTIKKYMDTNNINAVLKLMDKKPASYTTLLSISWVLKNAGAIIINALITNAA